MNRSQEINKPFVPEQQSLPVLHMYLPVSACVLFLRRYTCIVQQNLVSMSFSVDSTLLDIETRLTKAWTAINRLSIIWRSDITDKMKRSFFQAAVTSILLYGCTTWTLTKRLQKKLDGNYRRMLRAILNKSWRQHPTRHQLYGHLPPITKTIQVRRTRHAGHCWRSRDELIRDVMYSYGPPHMAVQKQDDQHEHTFSSYVRIRDVVLKTCLGRERVRDIRATSATWWWWYNKTFDSL